MVFLALQKLQDMLIKKTKQTNKKTNSVVKNLSGILFYLLTWTLRELKTQIKV